MAAHRELAALLGAGAVLPGDTRAYLHDATETRDVRGRADAIALPDSAEQVAETVRWCYAHDVPIIPRGGGSGYSGGAVPLDGGVVVSLERLNGVPTIEPAQWRAHAAAGTTTADLRRRAREEGLYYPPDPGAAEQSQLGGNIATNAGGPHTFKYGVTGHWISGLTFVVAPGEIVTVGGAARKDVAGYDLKSLMIGSEGTLGIVTHAHIRLIPAPEAQLPVVAFYPDATAGCAAIAAVREAGLQPAALEYLDEPAVATAIASYPGQRPGATPPPFMVIAEADGTRASADELSRDLEDALSQDALSVETMSDRAAIEALWRWRSGVSLAVVAQRGGKASEDIVVPVEHLAEAIAATREIGARHGLPACSWGHAGDGNLHSTVMLDLESTDELHTAEACGAELFALAARLGGAVSGEHGLGVVKAGALALQWEEPALCLHGALKNTFDPKNLLNPGKKRQESSARPA